MYACRAKRIGKHTSRLLNYKCNFNVSYKCNSNGELVQWGRGKRKMYVGMEFLSVIIMYVINVSKMEGTVQRVKH